MNLLLNYSQSTRLASQLERLRKDLDSQEQQLAALSQPCVQRLNTLLGKVGVDDDICPYLSSPLEEGSSIGERGA